MRRTVLLLSVFLLAASCDDPADVENPVSGIWHAAIPNFSDGLDVHLSFSFDQLTRTTVDGGVRLVIDPRENHPEVQMFKREHTLERVRHTSDGHIEIDGSVELGGPFGTLEFDGVLDNKNRFVFTYATDNGSGSATATYGGPYIRGNSQLAGGVLASVAPEFIGRFMFADFAYQFGGFLLLTATGPDNYGGVIVTGEVQPVGKEVRWSPYLKAPASPIISGDLWAGMLFVTAGNNAGDGTCTAENGYVFFYLEGFPTMPPRPVGPYRMSPDPDCGSTLPPLTGMVEVQHKYTD